MSKVQEEMDVGKFVGKHGTGMHQMSHKRFPPQTSNFTIRLKVISLINYFLFVSVPWRNQTDWTFRINRRSILSIFVRNARNWVTIVEENSERKRIYLIKLIFYYYFSILLLLYYFYTLFFFRFEFMYLILLFFYVII